VLQIARGKSFRKKTIYPGAFGFRIADSPITAGDTYSQQLFYEVFLSLLKKPDIKKRAAAAQMAESATLKAGQ